jgi:hypothetical protein
MQKKIVGTVLLLLLINLNVAWAQASEKSLHSREQLWFGAFNQTRFSERWGLWVDIHYRMSDHFVDRRFQFLVRPALTYFINDHLRINFGYALVQHFPGKGLSENRTEHRPWQQIWWNQKYPGLSTLQWIRLEQRFNERMDPDTRDGYNYNFRVRYNLAFLIPLMGKDMRAKTPFAAIMNEVFLNFGDRIVFNTFDQNRFFAGLGYPFTSHTNVQFGYMYIYQQEATGNNYLATHAIRLFLFHSVDLRKLTK